MKFRVELEHTAQMILAAPRARAVIDAQLLLFRNTIVAEMRKELEQLRAENARLKRHAAEHGRQIREMAASVKRDEKLWARLDELAGKVLEAT